MSRREAFHDSIRASLVARMRSITNTGQSQPTEIHMSLEQALAANTAALEANTAALKAAGGGASSTKSNSTTKGDDKPASKHTRDAMNAAINEVKEKKGADTAKKIIATANGNVEGKKLKDIPDAKIDETYEAAKAALTADEEM